MKKISTDKAPKAIGPYSQAVEANGVIYVSGQIPVDANTNQVVEGGIVEQAKTVLSNLSEILIACGSSLDNIVKTTCFLSDINDFLEFNKVYAEFIVNAPARSLVAVKSLPKGVLLEVDAIAVKGELC